ncbi:MAG: patatin-like phospholipase family protein [Proteobacteria bacterium]|nr:patatin-like phospholipase family protein [Pseudomonadota bacterium]
MKIRIIVLLSIIFTLFPIVCLADEEDKLAVKTAIYDDDAISYKRLKVGLALSGGGSRGASHVGVIKKLEELQIPIDYIAGTSMGSIVGGLYASGMEISDIESTIEGLDWEGAFKDEGSRENHSFRRKRDDDSNLVKLKVRLNNGKPSIPSGIVTGQKIDLLLNSLTLGVAEVKDFDLLSIPFRAVATDIVTGDEVVLSGGNLALAMRASM